MAREILTADKTWWVNHNFGNNGNDGSQAYPLASIQYAVNKILAEVDCAGFRPKVKVQSPSFQESNVFVRGHALGAAVGGDHQDIIIEGNPEHPDWCVWNVSAGCGIASDNAWIQVNGFKMVGLNNGLAALQSEKNGFIIFGNMTFSSFLSGYHLLCFESGNIYYDFGSYKIAGGFSDHVHIERGEVIIQPTTIQIPVGLTFDRFVYVFGPGKFQAANGLAFSGAGAGSGSSGRKYRTEYGGFAHLSGVTLPGNIAGDTPNGGFVSP